MTSLRSRSPAPGPLRGVGLFAALLLAAGLHSCGLLKESPFPTAPAVVSVVVKPATDTLTVSETLTLKASPKDAAGNTLHYRSVTWSTTSMAVAPVDANGKVAALTPGGVTITATCEGVTGTSVVTVVLPIIVASVTVNPLSATINTGATIRLAAIPKDTAGNVISGRSITWTSDNTAVATVDGTGLVTGRSAGVATVSATCSGKTGASAITVVTSAPFARSRFSQP